MRAGPPRSQWRGLKILLENKIPWFNRNCYGVGQDLACMLSEKFPAEVKVRQIARGGKFSKRNGWPYIIYDSNRNIRRSIDRCLLKARDPDSVKSCNSQESPKLFLWFMGIGNGGLG
jgi:hypothetical protein